MTREQRQRFLRLATGLVIMTTLSRTWAQSDEPGAAGATTALPTVGVGAPPSAVSPEGTAPADAGTSTGASQSSAVSPPPPPPMMQYQSPPNPAQQPPPPSREAQASTVSRPSSVATGPVGVAPLESGPVAVKGKWNPTLYGFLDVAAFHDSTQSYSIASPGYVGIARPETYAGSHGRTIFDARGTRFGFRLAAPEFSGIRATGVMEADFLGNQLPVNYGTSAAGISEGSASTSPLLRLRHAALKLETDYVDVLVGQYWQLFGWQPHYFPLTAQVPGFPGHAFGRAPQIRVSHTFKSDYASLELAVAAARAPQRNSEWPDGQAGIRVMLNRWRGTSAIGGTGALEQPASLGVSGTYRQFKVPEFSANPTARNSIAGKGLAVDLFLPVIRSHLKDQGQKGNALTVTGSFTWGSGIGDLYSPGVPGNAGFPALPNPGGLSPAPTWPQDIDNGIVTYDAGGRLRAIRWITFLAGAQYFVPPKGRVWLGSNIGYAKSGNLKDLGLLSSKVIPEYLFWDVVAFVEVTPAVNVGAEFAQIAQTYADDKDVKNSRVLLSGCYSFW
jgi:hypothetical protein